MSESPLHHLVKELGSELVATSRGLRLPNDALQSWAHKLAEPGVSPAILTDLLVLARRLADAGAHEAVAQLVVLVTVAGGAQAGSAVAEAAGTDQARARRLIEAAPGKSDPAFVTGLTPPARPRRGR